MKVQPWQLKFRQAMPLDLKIQYSQARIRSWYEHWNGKVYVSFSGGKDSTVLLHLVREMYPHVPAVFVNTGLEYPEIVDFVKTIDNVIWLKPKMNFKEVIEKYGYPVISKEVSQKISEARTTKSAKLLHKRLHGDNNKYKSGKIPDKWQRLINSPFKISHKCCHYLKIEPIRRYEKQSGNKSFVGLMASDSHARKQKYMTSGCNGFETKKKQSLPMAFWKEIDVWWMLKVHNKISYSKIYDMGYDRTGCMFCLYGIHLEKGVNRFQRMLKTHPKQYNYCINKLGCGKVLDCIGVNYGEEKQLSLF